MFFLFGKKKWLNKEEEVLLVRAIQHAESRTTGEIRVHLCKKIHGDILHTAETIFTQLKMHETPDRNGVLILLCPPLQQFAIWGDKNVHAALGQAFWDSIKIEIESHFVKKAFLDGLVAAVEHTGAKLAELYPKTDTDLNDLSDEITYS